MSFPRFKFELGYLTIGDLRVTLFTVSNQPAPLKSVIGFNRPIETRRDKKPRRSVWSFFRGTS